MTIYRQSKGNFEQHEEVEIFTKKYTSNVGGKASITCDGNKYFGEPDSFPEMTVEEPKTEIDYKFLINFRRGNNYKGNYGFDWMRDEYIEPLEKVLYDNNNPPVAIKKNNRGKAESTKTNLCTNHNELKKEYKPFHCCPIKKEAKLMAS